MRNSTVWGFFNFLFIFYFGNVFLLLPNISRWIIALDNSSDVLLPYKASLVN